VGLLVVFNWSRTPPAISTSTVSLKQLLAVAIDVAARGGLEVVRSVAKFCRICPAFFSFYQCCGSGFRSGSVRIRNFLQDPDPLLEVMDPDSDPKLDLNTKNHQKN
jgi:hypothetical protein